VGYAEEAEWILNPNWAEGKHTSIQTGVKNLLEREPKLDAIILLTCDQPYVDESLLTALIETWRRTSAKIVASQYARTAGIPALFNRSMCSKLLRLTAPSGKRLIEAHAAECAFVPFPRGSVDVDTPENYVTLMRSRDGRVATHD